jgi:hypothetical protein
MWPHRNNPQEFVTTTLPFIIKMSDPNILWGSSVRPERSGPNSLCVFESSVLIFYCPLAFMEMSILDAGDRTHGIGTLHLEAIGTF